MTIFKHIQLETNEKLIKRQELLVNMFNGHLGNDWASFRVEIMKEHKIIQAELDLRSQL